MLVVSAGNALGLARPWRERAKDAAFTVYPGRISWRIFAKNIIILIIYIKTDHRVFVSVDLIVEYGQLSILRSL